MAPGGRSRTLQRAWKRKFLDALEQGVTVREAAASAGVGRSTAYEARESDADFASAWDTAYEEGTDVLEQEAFRRAVEGTRGRPVVADGQIIAEVQEYSDTLMTLLLKARRPSRYRERVDVKHSGQIAAPTAAELEANRAAGLDEKLAQALANVASLDAARNRKAG